MQKQGLTVIPVLLSLALLAGCERGGPEVPEPEAPSDSGSVATVNGEPVSQALFDAFAKERGKQAGGELSEEQRDELLGELIDLELLVQEAKEQGLHSDPEIAGELIAQYKTTLARALVQRRLEDTKVEESRIQEAYDERVSDMGGKEYKASHILVEEKETAEELIGQLEGGADFTALAKEHSTGPSASQGGDLGWFSPDQMVAPFAEALVELETGQYTKEPVQTEFGWHVILLEDERELEAPSLDEMRGELTEGLRRQSIQDHIAELRDEADIQRK